MIDIALLTCLMLSQADQQTETTTYDTTLNFHFYKQFESSIDSGGDVDSSHAGVELRVNVPFSDNDDLLMCSGRMVIVIKQSCSSEALSVRVMKTVQQ